MKKAKVIQNNKKMKLELSVDGEILGVPVIVSMERKTSTRDFVSLSSKELSLFLDFCKKNLLSSDKNFSPEAFVGDAVSTKDGLLLSCSCTGGFRSHAMLFELSFDGDAFGAEISFLSSLWKKEKRRSKYVWTDAILLCAEQVRVLLQYVEECKDHLLAENDIKVGNYALYELGKNDVTTDLKNLSQKTLHKNKKLFFSL